MWKNFITKLIFILIFNFFPLCSIFYLYNILEVLQNLSDGIVHPIQIGVKANSFVKMTYTGFKYFKSSKNFAHVSLVQVAKNITDLEWKIWTWIWAYFSIAFSIWFYQFGFMNDKNEWDNNFGNDFHLRISSD